MARKRKHRRSEGVTARKLSRGSPCLPRPYFITSQRSLGGNQAYLAAATRAPPPAPPSPPKQLLLPSFLLCLAMGKMKRGTYQLNAYTSDWGGGRSGGSGKQGRLCLWSLGREGAPTPLSEPLRPHHQKKNPPRILLATTAEPLVPFSSPISLLAAIQTQP